MDRTERLSSFFKTKGRDTALIDFDGTLVDSRWAFMVQMLKACSVMGVPFEFLDKAVNDMRHTHMVNPTIMPAAVHEVSKRMGFKADDPRTVLALKHVERIYTRGNLYRPFEGAIQRVQDIKEAGLKTVLVTHGGERYTNIKLDANNMRHLFDLIICLDTMQPKSEQWEKEVFEKHNIDPIKCVGIGDNYPADHQVPQKLGVMIIWVGSGKGFNSERNTTINYMYDFRINEIGELVDKLTEIE